MFNFLIYLNIGILCTLIIVNFVAPHLELMLQLLCMKNDNKPLSVSAVTKIRPEVGANVKYGKLTC